MLRQLEEKIGAVKLRRMLDKALIATQRDYAGLRESLEQQNQNREQAIKYAHSLKSTASLLECHEFVRKLEIVEQNNLSLMNQPEFLQQLEQEYRDCLDRMHQ